MLESAEALLQLRRCSAPLVGQEQAGAQPACSGSVGTHSLPKELAQKAKPILGPFDFGLVATGFCVSPPLLVALISSASLETCPLLDAGCFPAAFPWRRPACPRGQA